MLRIFTTELFAEWFAGLDEKLAVEVAAAVDLIEQLGVERAPPGSRELLLWYEERSVTRFGSADSLSWDLEAWGAFRDYAQQVLAKLESPRFSARLERLGGSEARTVLRCIAEIKRAADPRLRWALMQAGVGAGTSSEVRPETACIELRRLYFAALEAAGFEPGDVPAYSRALREFSRRDAEPAFRLLYGVHAEKEMALLVLGERLERNYYGDSVRRAERIWKQFLEGELGAVERLRRHL